MESRLCGVPKAEASSKAEESALFGFFHLFLLFAFAGHFLDVEFFSHFD